MLKNVREKCQLWEGDTGICLDFFSFEGKVTLDLESNRVMLKNPDRQMTIGVRDNKEDEMEQESSQTSKRRRNPKKFQHRSNLNPLHKKPTKVRKARKKGKQRTCQGKRLYRRNKHPRGLVYRQGFQDVVWVEQ